jgi:hypothetical protein
VYAVFAEMYRSSGIAHRAVMQLPLLAMVLIVVLSVYSHFNHDLCVSIQLLQYWFQAIVNLVAFLLFWTWQRHEFQRVAFRFIDRGDLSVVRADSPSNGIVFVLKGRRSLPARAWFRVPAQILALAFPFIFPLAAEPLALRMCSGAVPTRPLLEVVPAELVAIVVCMICMSFAWIIQWGGEGYAISESLIARTLERDKRGTHESGEAKFGRPRNS